MKAKLILLFVMLATVIGLSGCADDRRSTAAGNHQIVQNLFAQFGWRTVGVPVEGEGVMPNDFRLNFDRFPWRVYLDLSMDVGLDFSSLTGAKVRTLRYRIEDSTGQRLEYIRDHVLWAEALLDQDGKIRGAWLIYEDHQGNAIPGAPTYSLRAKTIEQVTGLTWSEYVQKHSGSGPVDATP